MRILDRVKQFWELRRLKAAARAHPSPATLGALAERYISFGRVEDAYRTAKQGISLFPTSDRPSVWLLSINLCSDGKPIHRRHRFLWLLRYLRLLILLSS